MRQVAGPEEGELEEALRSVAPDLSPARVVRIAQQVATALRAQMPGARPSSSALAAHLARVHARHGDPEEEVSWAEVALAFACDTSDPAALVWFERLLAARVRPVVLRMVKDPLRADEVLQLTRERLLLPTETGVRRLLSFVGGGSPVPWRRSQRGRLGRPPARARC